VQRTAKAAYILLNIVKAYQRAVECITTWTVKRRQKPHAKTATSRQCLSYTSVISQCWTRCESKECYMSIEIHYCGDGTDIEVYIVQLLTIC